VSETSAVRHASHAGQASRSNLASSDSSDQSSPFASLLDATDSAPISTAPALPSLPLTSLKTSKLPQDSAQAVNPDNAAAGQSGASDNTAASNQASRAVSVPLPAPATQSSTPPAPDPTAGQNTKGNSPADGAGTSPDPTLAALAANALAASPPSTNAAGTTPAPDSRSAKSKTDSKTNQAATAPVDPPQIVPTPQPLALPVSAPVALAPATGTTGSDQEGDGGELAALDALQANGPGGKGTAAPPPTAGTGAPAKPALSPALQPAQNPIPSDASQQASAADNAAADAAAATAAAATDAADARARERTASAQGTDQASDQGGDQGSDGAQAQGDAGAGAGLGATGANGTASASTDPSSTGNANAAAPTSKIEDAAKAALDAPLRASPVAASAHPGAQADGTQSTPANAAGLVTPAVLTTAAAPVAAPVSATTPAAVPISGLAVEIAASAQAGNNRFDIRLDPPELGRIEVQISVDSNGKATTKLVVDRPATLDLLQRDSGNLQRSLDQAGLQTSDNGLQFSLRDQGGFAGQNPYSNNGSGSGARIIIPDAQAAAVDAAAAVYSRAAGASGIDIRV
jgi:flagellar hook-length control protein FliK